MSSFQLGMIDLIDYLYSIQWLINPFYLLVIIIDIMGGGISALMMRKFVYTPQEYFEEYIAMNILVWWFIGLAFLFFHFLAYYSLFTLFSDILRCLSYTVVTVVLYYKCE